MNKKDEMKYVYSESISGETVRKARKSLGMTQKEFAEFTRVSKPTVERWEADEKGVTGPIVALVTLILGDERIIKKLELPKDRLKVRLLYMYEETVCTVIDVDEVMRRVKVYNYTDNVMKRAFGVNTEPTFEEYEEFLESRCFPRSRDKMKLELQRLGIPFYDPMLIIEKTEGRMANDHFWIRKA